jgi:hypothetical protein
MASKHTSVMQSFYSRVRIAVVLLAVISLTASLATRYSQVSPDSDRVASVKSQSPNSQRQRLLSNALQWNAPVASFSLFEPPRSAVFVLPDVGLTTNLTSESWLYNRPPPSC